MPVFICAAFSEKIYNSSLASDLVLPGDACSLMLFLKVEEQVQWLQDENK